MDVVHREGIRGHTSKITEGGRYEYFSHGPHPSNKPGMDLAGSASPPPIIVLTPHVCSRIGVTRHCIPRRFDSGLMDIDIPNVAPFAQHGARCSRTGWINITLVDYSQDNGDDWLSLSMDDESVISN